MLPPISYGALYHTVLVRLKKLLHDNYNEIIYRKSPEKLRYGGEKVTEAKVRTIMFSSFEYVISYLNIFHMFKSILKVTISEII